MWSRDQTRDSGDQRPTPLALMHQDLLRDGGGHLGCAHSTAACTRRNMLDKEIFKIEFDFQTLPSFGMSSV